MVSAVRQILGLGLAMIGYLGSIIICGLPKWKVTTFIGAHIVTAQIVCEGLWMNCVVQSTGQMQCRIYDAMLVLPQDLQYARVLMIIAIITGVFGFILFIVGAKCTNFVEDKASKAKVAIASGVIFIIAGILVLIPICWFANTIIRDSSNPLWMNVQRREFGESLYIGWASASLLFLGGGLLCSSCPPSEDAPHNVKYENILKPDLWTVVMYKAYV